MKGLETPEARLGMPQDPSFGANRISQDKANASTCRGAEEGLTEDVLSSESNRWKNQKTGNGVRGAECFSQACLLSLFLSEGAVYLVLSLCTSR